MSFQEVPFTRVGPGQHIRHVVQIIGTNGPHHNPSKIRYMAPPAVGHLLDAAVALSAANVVVAGANLGVSIAILQTVRESALKLDRLIETTEAIRRKVAHLAAVLDRVEQRQGQAALWQAFCTKLKLAEEVDGINLVPLLPLHSDIMTFWRNDVRRFDFPDPWYPSNGGDFIRNLSALLFGMRELLAAQINVAVQGAPNALVRTNPVEDYLPGLGIASAQAASIAIFRHAKDEAWKATKDRMWRTTDAFAANKTALVDVAGQELEHRLSGPFHAAMTTDLVDDLLRAFGDHLDWHTLNFAAVHWQFQNLASEWLWNTDAGALYRLYHELLWLDEGYERNWWKDVPHQVLMRLQLMEN